MEHAISKDGTRIAFDRAGDGPVLVLVNGAFNSRDMVPELVDGLNAHFTTVRYDRRGRGDSGDTPPYAVDREVEDLTAVIEAVGGQAYVYGMSSGGALSLIAAASGAPITGLAVMEPPYRLEGAPPAPDRYLERMTEFSTSRNALEAARLFVVEAVGMPPEQFEGLVASPMWPAFESMAHTLAYDATVMGDNQPPTEVLAAVSVPTIAFGSLGSPEWLRAGAKTVAETVPGATYRDVDGPFHDVPPDFLGPALTEYFGLRR